MHRGIDAHEHRRPRRRRTARGSRAGYNADEEDSPELPALPGPGRPASDGGRVRFYSHVPSRRRNRNDASGKRRGGPGVPGIDLSLVSLLSSKELEARLSPSSPRPQSDCSSDSDASANRGDDGIINHSKRRAGASVAAVSYGASGPLAVVDYGSIELDMRGSALDSIYNIGGNCKRDKGHRAGGRDAGRDLFVGGRHYSLKDGPRTKAAGGDAPGATARVTPIISNKTPTDAGGSAEDAAAASPRNPPRAVGRDRKRRRDDSASGTPIVMEETATTLEKAISFSPFARLLFCARPPFAVVHANAAYARLVEEGRADPCVAGQSLAPDAQCLEAEGLETLVARIVAELRVGSLDDEQQRGDAGRSRAGATRGSVGGRRIIRVIPVASDDGGASLRLVRDFQDGYGRRWPSGAGGAPPAGGGTDAASSFGHEDDGPIRSHYLLQIEPVGAD